MRYRVLVIIPLNSPFTGGCRELVLVTEQEGIVQSRGRPRDWILNLARLQHAFLISEHFQRDEIGDDFCGRISPADNSGVVSEPISMYELEFGALLARSISSLTVFGR